MHPDHALAPIAAITVGRRSPAELGGGGLAGPAYYGGGGASGFGGQFHVDGAVGFTHLAFIAAVRESVFSGGTDGTFRSRSFEFGFRI